MKGRRSRNATPAEDLSGQQGGKRDTNARRTGTMKRIVVLAAAGALSGCLATTTQKVQDTAANLGNALGLGSGSTEMVGPQGLAGTQADEGRYVSQSRRLDVIVAEFDPGLPDDPDDYEDEGVWPELRRAESRKWALDMKTALQDTGAFGDLWVAPDATATADLYVQGKILESNGEDARMEITVTDSTNRRWMRKAYSQRVKEHWHRDPRNRGKNPYAALFAEAAEDVAEALEDRDDRTLEQIRATSEIRFAASFAPEAFDGYLSRTKSRVTLRARPAAGDPMLARTNAILVRERLFLDDTQQDYARFEGRMAESYAVWQEQSLLEAKAARTAKVKGVAQTIGAVILTGVAIAGAVASAGSMDVSDQAAGMVTMGAGLVGAAVLGEAGSQNLKEARAHREALAELGESIDLEVAERNVSFEGQTVKLTGTLREQYQQWRAFLAKMHAVEATPEEQL